jgi:hypothetical protein
MDLCVHLPLIVTLVITLELEQVLQAVVLHSAILTSYPPSPSTRVVGGGGTGRRPRMGSGGTGDNLTTGKTG